MIYKSVHLGSYKEIQIPGVDNVITHVQFADDTLQFLNDDIDLLKAVKNILRYFQLFSRLNFMKSKLYWWRKEKICCNKVLIY